jgi:hypothetical protein
MGKMWSLIYVWIHDLKIMPMLQQFRIKMIQVIVNVAQQQSMVVVHNQRPTKNGNLNVRFFFFIFSYINNYKQIIQILIALLVFLLNVACSY